MRWLTTAAALVLVALLAWAVVARIRGDGPAGGGASGGGAVPVQVADIVRGPIQLRRVYSGSLEARAEFVVAAKIAGRVRRMNVDLSDPVARGQLVAELDDAEPLQSVAQAEAELQVARAAATAASNALEIAGRDLARLERLHGQGIASDSQIDTVRAEALSREGAAAVAAAQIARAEASLQAARIRLDYTRVAADWSGPAGVRVVSERFVDEGETVSANTPLVTVVSLDPITGVVFVTEQDYPTLGVDQPVALRTDAHGDRSFAGRVSRISPVFRQNSRQARVEITVDNQEHLLKPGMFIRAEIVLRRVEDATLVPLDALVTREGRQGLFVLAADGQSVSWREVSPGIRDAERVEIPGAPLAGRVVTLGQQMIGDGSRVRVADDPPPEPAPVDRP